MFEQSFPPVPNNSVYGLAFFFAGVDTEIFSTIEETFILRVIFMTKKANKPAKELKKPTTSDDPTPCPYIYTLTAEMRIA